jgi:transcription elongation GreA/GreB family factor
MGTAVVRESNLNATGGVPDRPISPHPNFVTQDGLAKIDTRLRELEGARTAGDRGALAGIERELRYWKQRRSSARMIAPPAMPEIVRFGVTVSVRFEDGSTRHYRLVGEDEAEPAAGLVSWTAPVGSALIGKRSGELVQLCGRQAQIIAMRA